MSMREPITTEQLGDVVASCATGLQWLVQVKAKSADQDALQAALTSLLDMCGEVIREQNARLRIVVSMLGANRASRN